MIVGLPYSLNVNGKELEINCDFRDVINALCACSDLELRNAQRNYILIHNLYVNDDEIASVDFEEAMKQLSWFIDCGKDYSESKNSVKLMDWEQDYNLIVSAVNKSANVLDVRELPFMHWWTFMGYFQERGECIFSSIVEIRDKLAKGKKLENYEKEFLNHNREQVLLKERLSDDEKQQLEELFGGV